MALPSSGLITLANLQAEFGGSNPISLSEYYRGGAYVPDSSYTDTIPTSGVITLQNFRGTSNVFTATISTNKTSFNVTSYLTSLGWNGVSYPIITINSGVYVYATSTSLAAMYGIPACKIINNGFIMGKGGNGNGGAGGDAMSLAGNITLDVNATGYIGGGGGAGTRGGSSDYSGGGGGAGGGVGGPSSDGYGGGAGGNPGSSGADGQQTSGDNSIGAGYGGTAGGSGSDWGTQVFAPYRLGGGGGGGRILPGALTAAPNVGSGNRYDSGSYGGGPEQAGESRNVNGVGSGGGGWGAKGGNTYTSGGAAGKAIDLNGYSCTILSYSSHIYGAIT